MVAYSRVDKMDRPPSERSKFFRPWVDSDEEPCNKKCCGVEFKKKREYKRHTLTAARHGHQTEKCPDCSKEFTRKDNLTRHRKMKHESDEKPKCKHCGKPLSRKDAVQRHEGTCHNNPNRQPSQLSLCSRSPNSQPDLSEPEVAVPRRPIPLFHPAILYLRPNVIKRESSHFNG